MRRRGMFAPRRQDIDGASSARAPRDFLARAGFAGEQDRRRQGRDACNGFTHAAPGLRRLPDQIVAVETACDGIEKLVERDRFSTKSMALDVGKFMPELRGPCVAPGNRSFY